MVTDILFWQKVWNRGVDIAVSVIASSISAAIVAMIATLTWRWKRKRDLGFEEDKQRQQHRLVEEFQNAERRRVDTERRNTLARQREGLAAAMLEADSGRIKEAWTNYWEWLTSNQLHFLNGNGGIPREHFKIRTMTHGDHTPLKQELAGLMRATALSG